MLIHNLDHKARMIGNRAHQEVLTEVFGGADYGQDTVRVATAHIQKDIAVLCFWSRDITRMLRVIAGVLLVNSALMLAIWLDW